MDTNEAAVKARDFHIKAENYRARGMIRCAQVAYEERNRYATLAGLAIEHPAFRWSAFIHLDRGEDDYFDDDPDRPELSAVGARIAVGGDAPRRRYDNLTPEQRDANTAYERDIARGLERDQRLFRENERINRRVRFGY